MPDGSTVQSLLRGLQLMTLVAQSADGLALREAAEQAGLKRPATHKLLRTLAASGFVMRETNPVRYRLGPAAFDLARMQAESELLRHAPAALTLFQKRFPAATVTLSRFIGCEVMPVLRMRPERICFLERPAEAIMSPYSSASTLIFQAFWPEERREEYRRRHPFSEYGAHLWKSKAALERFLSETRRAGCAEPTGKEEAYRVAAAVFNAGGTVCAALGARLPAGGRSSLAIRRRLRTAVIETARELSTLPDKRATRRGGKRDP